MSSTPEPGLVVSLAFKLLGEEVVSAVPDPDRIRGAVETFQGDDSVDGWKEAIFVAARNSDCTLEVFSSLETVAARVEELERELATAKGFVEAAHERDRRRRERVELIVVDGMILKNRFGPEGDFKRLYQLREERTGADTPVSRIQALVCPSCRGNIEKFIFPEPKCPAAEEIDELHRKMEGKS